MGAASQGQELTWGVPAGEAWYQAIRGAQGLLTQPLHGPILGRHRSGESPKN
jgi:hypothetical protein